MVKVKNEGFYSLDNILKTNALYYVIFGERSNGKTYACLKQCLKEFFEEGKEFAIIRRWDEDIKGSKGSKMFDNLINNGELTKLSKGEWSGIVLSLIHI